MSTIDQKCVDAIRVLSADMIQRAKSGHPGLPLGAAPAAYELWANHLNFNPADPSWANRDRFILSGGHGSALLYSLLHFYGCGGLSLQDIKDFRQLGSLTPGHPEYGHTVGVEATTGPLGSGMGMAVGMAMAEAHMASVFNKENYPVVDHYTFALGGDGCMMEGITYEAMSLAGTLKLGKLIVLYDSNRITIEGDTANTFTEDVAKRFEAFGFQTITVEDGNDLAAIGAAIEEAKADLTRPSLITVKTEIGYGCPAKQGKASAHGEPLGEENVLAMKDNLGWENHEPFYVPQDVYDHYKELAAAKAPAQDAWEKLYAAWREAYPELAATWDTMQDTTAVEKLIDDPTFWEYEPKAEATRACSGNILQRLKDLMPGLIGGSADLGPSNKTLMKDAGDFTADHYAGRNLHFGVREIAMGAIGNGLALAGMRPYVATFFVFSDYIKPMARLSALMGLPVTYVFSHDSIGVGEDGPTHEPVEQLAMFRSLPNFDVFRPADAAETAAGWYLAATSKTTPIALILTRQNNQPVGGKGKEALKGAYILADSDKETPDLILIASGSEVPVALGARKILASEGIDARVVSMPCMKLFDRQPAEYREAVLPKAVRARVAVEALSGFGWDKYTGLDGAVVCMEGFGASAPYSVLFPHFGFTAEHVAEVSREVVKQA